MNLHIYSAMIYILRVHASMHMYDFVRCLRNTIYVFLFLEMHCCLASHFYCGLWQKNTTMYHEIQDFTRSPNCAIHFGLHVSMHVHAWAHSYVDRFCLKTQRYMCKVLWSEIGM